MAWNKADLTEALQRYQRWLSARDLSPNTIHSHGYYAGVFVRWLYGEYAPRGRHPRPDPVSPTRMLSASDLSVELELYRNYLADNGLIPGAVQTYVQSAGLFVKWLAGSVDSDGRQQPLPTSGRADLPPRRSMALAAGSPTSEATDLWPGEGPVQSAVVAWLVSQGWSIVRVAQSRSTRTRCGRPRPQGRHGARRRGQGVPRRRTRRANAPASPASTTPHRRRVPTSGMPSSPSSRCAVSPGLGSCPCSARCRWLPRSR